MSKYILSVTVENNYGVLARVSSLFARRGFNIDSLTVSPTNNTQISKITIVVMGDENVLQQVLKQVSKLEEVIRVVHLVEDNSLCKELVLVKLKAENVATCSDISDVVSSFKARIIDIGVSSISVELSDIPSEVDCFIKTLNKFDIIDISRTGVTAIGRYNNPV